MNAGPQAGKHTSGHRPCIPSRPPPFVSSGSLSACLSLLDVLDDEEISNIQTSLGRNDFELGLPCLEPDTVPRIFGSGCSKPPRPPPFESSDSLSSALDLLEDMSDDEIGNFTVVILNSTDSVNDDCDPSTLVSPYYFAETELPYARNFCKPATLPIQSKVAPLKIEKRRSTDSIIRPFRSLENNINSIMRSSVYSTTSHETSSSSLSSSSLAYLKDSYPSIVLTDVDDSVSSIDSDALSSPPSSPDVHTPPIVPSGSHTINPEDFRKFGLALDDIQALLEEEGLSDEEQDTVHIFPHRPSQQISIQGVLPPRMTVSHYTHQMLPCPQKPGGGYLAPPIPSYGRRKRSSRSQKVSPPPAPPIIHGSHSARPSSKKSRYSIGSPPSIPLPPLPTDSPEVAHSRALGDSVGLGGMVIDQQPLEYDYYANSEECGLAF